MKLLLSALGTQFQDDDDLFIDHTLLVNTSEILAHAVLGLHVKSLAPATLLAGDKFAEAGAHGVVESDFFDWVVEVDGGEAFIRTLAKRAAKQLAPGWRVLTGSAWVYGKYPRYNRLS